MDPDSLFLERRLGSSSFTRKRVAAIIAVSAFLGVVQPLWATFLPSIAFPPISPAAAPAILAFCIGAAFSIALLSLGQFAFAKERYAFWLGTAFWLSSLVGTAQLLCLHGVFSGSEPASVYLGYLFYLVLLLPCVAFLSTPRNASGSLRGWLLTLTGSSLLCVIAAGTVLASAARLSGRFLSGHEDYMPEVFLALYLAAAALHWRRFRRSEEPLIGYFLGFLAVSLWAFPDVIRARALLRDDPWLTGYLFPTAGGTLLYVALLLGYFHLYRGLRTGLDQMALTHRLNTMVTGSLDLRDICQTLSEEIRKLVPCDRMTVSVFHSAERYRAVFGYGRSQMGTGDTETWIGEGSATEWVVKHGQPVICEDGFEDRRFPRTRRRYEALGMRSYVIFPLVAKGRVLGTVHLASAGFRSYGEREIEILRPVLEMLSVAVENATLYQEARKREEMQRLLKEVSQEITLLDIDVLLKKFSDRVREIFKVDISNVRLIVNGVRRIVGVSGIDAERLRATATGSGRGVSGWMMNSRRALAVPDITQELEVPMGETNRAIGVRGYLGVPLFSKDGEVMGIVQALSYQPRHFRQEEIDLLEQLANGIAIAVENSRLLDHLKSANEQLEQSARDQQTIREFLSDILFLKLDDLFQKVTEQAAALFQAEYGWLRLFDETGRIRTRVVVGGEDVVRRGAVYGEAKLRGRSKRMLESGKPLTVRDMAEDPNSPYHGTVKAAGLRGFLGAPMFSKDKKPLGLLFVTTRQPRDFTQREVALIEQFARGIAIAIENAGLFEEARKKSHELEDAYRAKSDFLNTMSHELRTPLNVIIGGEQLLADGFFGDLTEEQAKGLEPVGRNARDLLRLINGILDLARLEARRVPLCVEEFALRGLMDELESSFAALAREKGLRLKFEEANGIRLRSDRAKVKDILQNLIGNAVKYTERGEVRISVESPPSGGERNGGAMLSVRDTGIGIQADELGKVFEPFYMVEGVDREKYPGSGLGLSIVRRTVELLGGSIAVESEFGNGSAFTVTLPDLPAPPEPMIERRNTPGRARGDSVVGGGAEG